MSQEVSELVNAIVEWSGRRPIWERHAIGKLARSERMGEDIISELADMAESESSGAATNSDDAKTSDFEMSVSGTEPVNVVAIASPQSVNALTWDEGLSFASGGMTIVYGENGSGKSGYARVLKKVTRARSNADVLLTATALDKRAHS